MGVGGYRALEAAGVTPSVWHLNEGHSALVSFERIRRAMENGEPLVSRTPWRKVAKTSAFTTHTPVPAGNETFELPLVRAYAEAWGAGLAGRRRSPRSSIWAAPPPATTCST